jgi:hypothetical protein
MWNHNEYIAFFKEIARKNKSILHTETDSHFVRIIPVDDPFAALDVQQYENDQRSKFHMPGLMLQLPQTTLNDPGDSLTSIDDLAFFIWDKPKSDKFSSEDDCITKTEIIAWQVLAYLKNYFLTGQSCPPNKVMRINSVLIDTVKDGKFWGTKVSFRLNSGANAEFKYNADDWEE